MKKLFAFSLVLSFSALAFGQSLPPSNAERNLQITVRVDNRVHVPPDELARAEMVATQILRLAGVRAVWLDCSTTVATGQRQPLCDRPPEPTDLFLDFDEEIQSWSPNMRENTLGFALIPGGDRQGDRAYISSPHVHKTATRFATSSAMILGLAAAHEIGHLLMGSSDHSPSGIMRAGWDVEDIRRAAQGDLQFTNDQVKKLRAGLFERMTHQNVAQAEAAVSR
jgi:hypothetical protein